VYEDKKQVIIDVLCKSNYVMADVQNDINMEWMHWCDCIRSLNMLKTPPIYSNKLLKPIQQMLKNNAKDVGSDLSNSLKCHMQSSYSEQFDFSVLLADCACRHIVKESVSKTSPPTSKQIDILIAQSLQILVSQGFVNLIDLENDRYELAFPRIRSRILDVFKLSCTAKHIVDFNNDGISLNFIWTEITLHLKDVQKDNVLEIVNELISESILLEFGVQKYSLF
jgi:hypothetical protein